MRKLIVLVSVLATAFLPAVLLSPASAAGSYKVTAKFSATSINFGQEVTVSGKVTPAAGGLKVRIQKSHDDQDYVGWETVVTVNTRSDGTFSKTFKPSIGTYQWRVYKQYGAGKSGGVSTPVTIRAYSWYQLVNATYLDVLSDTTGGPGRYGPITVAGTGYKSYWESKDDASGSTRWYLERNCRRFIGTVGLDDARSGPNAFGRVLVHGSPDLLLNKSMNGNTKLAVDVSFTPSKNSWITISASRANGEDTSVVVANAKVQCSFPHNEGDA